MELDSERAQNKKSLLSMGVLMLSLAALQGPLWRAQQPRPDVAVRAGGAVLVQSDRPVAEATMAPPQPAVAEIVGEREVLVRGKELGETQLTVALKDGRKVTYRVKVQAESAQTPLRGFAR